MKRKGKKCREKRNVHANGYDFLRTLTRSRSFSSVLFYSFFTILYSIIFFRRFSVGFCCVMCALVGSLIWHIIIIIIVGWNATLFIITILLLRSLCVRVKLFPVRSARLCLASRLHTSYAAATPAAVMHDNSFFRVFYFSIGKTKHWHRHQVTYFVVVATTTAFAFHTLGFYRVANRKFSFK